VSTASTPGAPLLLAARDVSRVYRAGEVDTWALRDVNLSIARGEFIVLRGPSGCGKSTLLGILGLLDAPSAGSVVVDGRSTAGLAADERARLRGLSIGFVFQAFNLIPYFDVLRNVELPLSFHRALAPSERRARALEALAGVGLAELARRMPDQLSGGQQQRVAIARALVGTPAIILADEPTGNLDSVTGDQVMGLLQDAHRAGATVCLVTHDPRYERLGTRHVHLLDGRVVSD
jgi:putative ABC transport system ATP-binding protein